MAACTIYMYRRYTVSVFTLGLTNQVVELLKAGGARESGYTFTVAEARAIIEGAVSDVSSFHHARYTVLSSWIPVGHHVRIFCSIARRERRTHFFAKSLAKPR